MGPDISSSAHSDFQGYSMNERKKRPMIRGGWSGALWWALLVELVEQDNRVVVRGARREEEHLPRVLQAIVGI